MHNLLTYFHTLLSLKEKDMSLPNQYQRVAWIESSGTQYIDTTVVLNQDSRVTISGYMLEVSKQVVTYPNVFGARTNNTKDFAVGINGTHNNKVFLRYGAYVYDNTPNYALNPGEFEFDCNKNYWDLKFLTSRLSFAKKMTEQTFSTDKSAYIFGANNGSDNVPTVMRLYSCKIYDDEVLIRDFIPCYRKVDNAAGVYDLVNGVFYTNAGTGDFIVGEDI